MSARGRLLQTGGLLTASLLLLSGCAAGGTATSSAATQLVAEEFTQVSEVHEATGMALLEGPTFGADGHLYLVDVVSGPGEPKLLKVDVTSKEVSSLYTDDSGAYSSAQFSPKDGKLYLSDIAGGRIISMNADGSEAETFFAGQVDGRRVSPDDIAFNEDGDLFVSDFTAFPGVPLEAAQAGRIIRIDADSAKGSVVAEDLPSTNGISFNEDFTALWLSQYAANRIDLLKLNAQGTQAAAIHPAVYVDGGEAQVDSNAVDAAGNVYQMFEHDTRVDVYSPKGQLLAQVKMPEAAQGLDSATNIAIKPGTTEGFITVSGAAGGFIYTFESLAEGIRQTNGG
ncbi:hypothetical protein CIK76_10520 [Glutamicibacter sp. BW80]|uniref:SMP-30/gluconolactonase/LRE family protein n=1 Tax=unclassified Glutamicibacter TaxID=2627139 RepID=UPI000BB7A24A|nr:SMP-30/gluconolactonase/LRE family protein [Glutamicibacter sp. BW80]PCC28642.1 hypothetical protein CIK76_10520 [Glutamicibacter sp. BW80]